MPSLETTDEAGSSGALRAQIVEGLAWKGASQVVTMGSRLAVGIALAHLLTPAQFGIAGMAFVFSNLAVVLADPAMSAALVRMPVVTEDDRSTVFWTTAASGLVGSLVAVASAPLVAGFFGHSQLTPLFAVEAVTIFLLGLSTTHAALLTREMNFRGLELREIGGTLVGAAVGLALAVAGFGAWAIILQSLATVCMSTLLLWTLSSWRPQRRFSKESFRSCGIFGTRLYGARFLAYLNGNADNLLVGRFLGSRSLGLYSVAYNLMYSPIGRLTEPIQHVLTPAFARIQGDRGRLIQGFLRGSQLITGITSAAMLGMIAVAPDLVPVLLGPRWQKAVPVVQLLCAAGMVQGLQTLQISLLQARGRAEKVLRFMLLSSFLNVTAFALGVHWGIIGVAACFAVSRFLALPVITTLTSRELDVRPLVLVRNLAGVFVSGLAMFIVAIMLRLVLRASGVPPAPRLAIVVVAALCVFVAASALSTPQLLTEVRGLLVLPRRRRPRTSGALN